MLTLAYSLFWVNFLYGIAVKFNLFDHKKFKVIHHLIYFFVMLSLFISIVYEFYTKKFLSMFLLIILFLFLSIMTRFSGRNSSHWRYAILCNILYTIVFVYLTQFNYGTL